MPREPDSSSDFRSPDLASHYRRPARFVKAMWPITPPFGFGAINELPAKNGLSPVTSVVSGCPPQLLARYGTFEIRLAKTKEDVRNAQRLRYNVFYEEGGAVAQRAAALVRRDLCPFDKFCDHLLVTDMAARNSLGRLTPKVVGTYRLLRGEIAARHGGFYSHGEFDIAPLIARHAEKRFLELGRSCVHPKYRSKRVIELLWRGLWIYAKYHKIDVLVGCASLPGTNPLALALPLSFLHHQASAETEWQVRPRPDRAVPMAILEKTAIDARRGIAALPPLIKAYVRIGAKFGKGAVIDKEFGTIDVFTIMPIAEIEARYIAYFGTASDAKERVAA
jgi:putative hemolysin